MWWCILLNRQNYSLRCCFVAVLVNWNYVVTSPYFVMFKKFNAKQSLEPDETPSNSVSHQASNYVQRSISQTFKTDVIALFVLFSYMQYFTNLDLFLPQLTQSCSITVIPSNWQEYIYFTIQYMTHLIIFRHNLVYIYKKRAEQTILHKHTPTSHAKHTHGHTTTHTASVIHLLTKIHARHTYNNGVFRNTTLARSEIVIYYRVLRPVFVRTYFKGVGLQQ